MMWFVSALLWFVIALTATINSIELVQPPVVYLGQLATFTCDVGPAPSAGWMINDTSIGNLSLEVGSDVQTCPKWECGAYSLTILAKAEYNMTKIQCFALSKNPEQRGIETAYLIIRVPDDLIPSSSVLTATPTSGETSTGDRGSTVHVSPTVDLTITPTVNTSDPTSDSKPDLPGILAGTLSAAIVSIAAIFILCGLLWAYKYHKKHQKWKLSKSPVEEEGPTGRPIDVDISRPAHSSDQLSSAQQETNAQPDDKEVTLKSLANIPRTSEPESTDNYQPTQPNPRRKPDLPKTSTTRDNYAGKTSDESPEVENEEVPKATTNLSASTSSLCSNPDLMGPQIYQAPKPVSD